ncbi:hypothetical protein BDR26DRAFT_871708 [Obelidium mucronatum]|nr:hypothetical protein BDR26DRAFT_871708 [Obelidium mucronatum]
MDVPTLLSEATSPNLTPSSSTSSFGSEAGTAAAKTSHSAITDALLALMPTAAMTANIPQPSNKQHLAARQSQASFGTTGTLGAANEEKGKKVRFADPLVSFCIAHSKIELDDVDLESVLTVEYEADDLAALDLGGGGGVGGSELEEGEDQLDLLDHYYSDEDGDNDADLTSKGVLLSDDEDEEDDEDGEGSGGVGAAGGESTLSPTLLPLPNTTSKRGLVRSTRRPMLEPKKNPHHMVDELDLLRSKKKGILKISDQPPLVQAPLSPPSSPKRTPRSSRSTLLVSMAINPSAPIPTSSSASVSSSLITPKGSPVSAATDPVPASRRTTMGRPSSNGTLSGISKKKALVSRTTFEQSAMYLNF